ncbi:MAG: DUF4214 domain-containing protein [Saccharofermentans sp.]|nr:DUF4214 domain-containing protein [Saccharofermentans sp.]
MWEPGQPDPVGKAYWLGRLAGNATRAEVINGFIRSSEWYAMCRSYGIRP